MIERFVTTTQDLTAQDVHDMFDRIRDTEHLIVPDIAGMTDEIMAIVTVASCQDKLTGELEAYGTADIEAFAQQIQDVYRQYIQNSSVIPDRQRDQYEKLYKLILLSIIDHAMTVLRDRFIDIGYDVTK